ncbi:Uncharacterised protein [Chlamydia abortus]|nr:Uncharacterised protein [Chlamydia abortus]
MAKILEFSVHNFSIYLIDQPIEYDVIPHEAMALTADNQMSPFTFCIFSGKCSPTVKLVKLLHHFWRYVCPRGDRLKWNCHTELAIADFRWAIPSWITCPKVVNCSSFVLSVKEKCRVL